MKISYCFFSDFPKLKQTFDSRSEKENLQPVTVAAKTGSVLTELLKTSRFTGFSDGIISRGSRSEVTFLSRVVDICRGIII